MDTTKEDEKKLPTNDKNESEYIGFSQNYKPSGFTCN